MVQSSRDILKDLHHLENIPDLADYFAGPFLANPGMGVNTHLHLPPNFSAFDDTDHLVRLAREQDVRILGVSNYYDFNIYEAFALKCREQGIFPLFGLEIIYMDEALRRSGFRINDPGNPGKVYICGKGISRFRDFSPEAGRLMEVIRRNDAERMARMIEKLNEIFMGVDPGISMTPGKVIETIAARCGAEISTIYIQERHIALAFQEWLFEHITEDRRKNVLTEVYQADAKIATDDPVGVQADLRKYLMKNGKPAFVQEIFIHHNEAVRLILELGGVPTYPVLLDGSDPICEFETSPESLIRELKQIGIQAVEFIPIRNSHALLEKYVTMLHQAGFVITAGTEHNTLDLPGIEPVCVNGMKLSDELKSIFREGACVLAAHQYLQFNGRQGYVDGNGQPHPGFDSAQERNHAFARLGQSLLNSYFHGSSVVGSS
jgi:hypothetical protein